MSSLSWTADMEASLFYAMIDHKPVGENKHFHMIFIHDKYNNLNEKKINADQIWEHLGRLYDLNALNENEVIPFPNDDVTFSLPESKFGAFLKISKTNLEIKETQPQPKAKSKGRSSTNETKEKDSAANNNSKESMKDNFLVDEENNSNNSDDVEVVPKNSTKTPKNEARKRVSVSSSSKLIESGSKKSQQTKKRKD